MNNMNNINNININNNHSSYLASCTGNSSNEHNTNTRFKRSIINFLYIDLRDINFDSFSRLILSNLKVNVSYCLLFKVKYNDTEFGMIGSQDGITLSSTNDSESIQTAW